MERDGVVLKRYVLHWPRLTARPQHQVLRGRKDRSRPQLHVVRLPADQIHDGRRDVGHTDTRTEPNGQYSLLGFRRFSLLIQLLCLVSGLSRIRIRPSECLPHPPTPPAQKRCILELYSYHKIPTGYSMLEVEPTGHRYGRRKWPKRQRSRDHVSDGNGNGMGM